ncbi:MAG: hypothetical protein HY040_02015 [Planctomycetes bacterium]|nr:hypothetical protein [Planctomycetota bacterium]
MNPSANVLATATLVDFRAALCTFADHAKDALGMLDMDIRRARDWLEDQKSFWQKAVRQAEDRLFQAKSELTRRRMMRIADRPPDCTEQEEALEKARRRLEIAQERLANCRRWQRALPEALIDYEGPSNQLTGLLEGQTPRMLAYLEKKIASLEAYTQEQVQ